MTHEAALLLTRLKREQQRTSDRMHRDARRQTALKQASLMLGTGISAEGVLDWLTAQHIVLNVSYDTYGRTAGGGSA